MLESLAKLSNILAETYKINLIKSLLFQSFNLCPHFVRAHHEVDALKRHFCEKLFPA